MRTILLSLTLVSCASPKFNVSMDRQPTVALRASVGSLSGDLTATANVQKGRTSFVVDQETVGDDGSAFRGDLSYIYGDGSGEIGAFVGRALPSFGDIEAEASDIGLVSRSFFRNTEKLRPYAEVRIGVRDMSAKGMVPGFPDEASSGALFYGGIGAGLEYRLGGGAAVHIQIDGSYSQGGLGSTDIMTKDYGVMLGGSWRF